MKKLILILLVFGIAFQASAKLKNKQVVGKWKYIVDAGGQQMTGIFKFIEKEGALAGDVITDDGYTLPFSKIELKENNGLYLEIKTDNDVIKVDVIVDGEKFSGTGSSYDGDAPIKGEKIKE